MGFQFFFTTVTSREGIENYTEMCPVHAEGTKGHREATARPYVWDNDRCRQGNVVKVLDWCSQGIPRRKFLVSKTKTFNKDGFHQLLMYLKVFSWSTTFGTLFPEMTITVYQPPTWLNWIHIYKKGPADTGREGWFRSVSGHSWCSWLIHDYILSFCTNSG